MKHHYAAEKNPGTPLVKIHGMPVLEPGPALIVGWKALLSETHLTEDRIRRAMAFENFPQAIGKVRAGKKVEYAWPKDGVRNWIEKQKESA